MAIAIVDLPNLTMMIFQQTVSLEGSRSHTGWWFQTFWIFHFIYGMSSFSADFHSIIFEDGEIAPPTRLLLENPISILWNYIISIIPYQSHINPISIPYQSYKTILSPSFASCPSSSASKRPCAAAPRAAAWRNTGEGAWKRRPCCRRHGNHPGIREDKWRTFRWMLNQLLVGGLEHEWIIFPIIYIYIYIYILGMSSSQLTNSIIFQRRWNHQPVSNWWIL